MNNDRLSALAYYPTNIQHLSDYGICDFSVRLHTVSSLQHYLIGNSSQLIAY